MGSQIGSKFANGAEKRGPDNYATKIMRNEGQTQSTPIANGVRFGPNGGKGGSFDSIF